MATQLNTLLDDLLSEYTPIESDIDAFSNDNVNIVKPLSANNSNIRWNNLQNSDYHCLRCRCRGEDTMHWTECHHRYCQNCISNIINENVSLKNEIPQCPKCNQSLNIQRIAQDTFKWTYPQKYKITLTFKQYTNMNKLIHGYIRTIQTIPNEIILIIFDFYHLNYVKTIKCNKCISTNITPCSPPHIPFIEHMTLSQASKLTINDKIDHRDKIGKFIAATIIDKQGTNLKIHYHNWSHKWDVWSDSIEELYRFAKYESISKRAAHRFKTLQKGSYINMHPRRKHIGWKLAEIRRIDKQSGQIQAVYEYNDENYLYWIHLDNAYEIAPFITTGKDKKYIPTDCNSCVLTLDFRQLCNKQKLCMKCNEFYPIDSIIFWYKCNHILCIECFMKYAKNEITQNKIPICPAINCHNTIAPNEYEYQNNISFLLNSWQKSNENKRYIVKLYAKLTLLLFRKDKFECSICNKWHPNIDLFPDKNKNCQHKYSNECYSYLALLSNCGHSDCLKCLSLCEICHKFDENKQLVGWTKCEHKYHKYCAKKYINEWIVPSQTMFSKLLNTSDMIPLCIHKNCNKLLDIMSAELMGVTEYQCNVLYEMRKESILIKTINKRICYKYETIDKKVLVNQDFSSASPST